MSLVKRIRTVLYGTAGAQAITLLVSPILARQFGPEAFGVFGLFMMWVSYLATVTGGRYEMAIVLPDSDKDAKVVFRASLYLAFANALFLTLLIAFYQSTGLSFSLLNDVGHWIWFIPFYLIINQLALSLDYYLTRLKAFGKLSAGLLTGSMVGNSAKVGLGALAPAAGFLVIGNLLTLIVQIFTQAYLGRSALEKTKDMARGITLRQAYSRYRDLPIYRAPKDLMTAVSFGLPVAALGIFFSPGVVGLFVLSDRIMRAPVVVVGAAIRKVLYQRSAELKNKSIPVFHFNAKAVSILLCIGFLGSLVMFLIGAELFVWIFGEDWNVAGSMAVWLSLWLFSSVANIPATVLVPVFNLESVFFKVELAWFVLRALSIFALCNNLSDPVQVIAGYSIIGLIGNLYLIAVVLFRVKKLEKGVNYDAHT